MTIAQKIMANTIISKLKGNGGSYNFNLFSKSDFTDDADYNSNSILIVRQQLEHMGLITQVKGGFALQYMLSEHGWNFEPFVTEATSFRIVEYSLQETYSIIFSRHKENGNKLRWTKTTFMPNVPKDLQTAKEYLLKKEIIFSSTTQDFTTLISEQYVEFLTYDDAESSRIEKEDLKKQLEEVKNTLTKVQLMNAKAEIWPKKYWWAVSSFTLFVGFLSGIAIKQFPQKIEPQQKVSILSTPIKADTLVSHKTH